MNLAEETTSGLKDEKNNLTVYLALTLLRFNSICKEGKNLVTRCNSLIKQLKYHSFRPGEYLLGIAMRSSWGSSSVCSYRNLWLENMN